MKIAVLADYIVTSRIAEKLHLILLSAWGAARQPYRNTQLGLAKQPGAEVHYCVSSLDCLKTRL